MKGRNTFLGLLALSTVVYLSFWREATSGRAIGISGTDPNEKFSWSSITPTKELVWYKCYEGFQCARLEVPLDYADADGAKAAIALIRKPALISPRLPFYKGPVLFNPGGPGGSGVELVRRAGFLFSIILGPQFDIVSFDPRGVGRSTPRASFFSTDAERAMFGLDLNLRVVNTSVEGVSRSWAAFQLMGKLAAENDDGYLAHINTPNTARDMLSIVEAHGEEQLQYWGFSYGSILGSTFATMFPDKVKRLVIDGVMDAEDYYSTGWRTNLADTDKVFDAFFDGCASAGPDRCAFYSPQPDDIRQNLTRIFDQVKHQPIPVRTETSYGLLDYTRLRAVVFVSLYQPYALFPVVADALAKLAAGNATAMFSLASQPPYRCSCDETERAFDTVRDGQFAILCNDGTKVPPDLSDAEDHFKELAKTSQFADMWTDIRTSCTGWPNPSRSFKKPFVANTSHPVLVVGNTADPVTPLRSAKKMSEGFKDSVVLTQDSPGHCSISAPSVCTQNHIRRYFIRGVLPEPGTVCKPVGSPFPPKFPKQIEGQDLEQMVFDNVENPEELNASFWDAVKKLSLAYPLDGRWKLRQTLL